jgi:hypothetical protein
VPTSKHDNCNARYLPSLVVSGNFARFMPECGLTITSLTKNNGRKCNYDKSNTFRSFR